MKRIKWLDVGKGITIFFVLIGHVLGGLHEVKEFQQYDTLIKILQSLIFTFIMPVFFALSGYLYNTKRGFSEFSRQIFSKLSGLGIPYVLFSFIYVLLQHVSSSGVHNLIGWNRLLEISWKPIGYLWFLYVLFFVFVLVGIIDQFRLSIKFQILIYVTLFLTAQIINLPYIFDSTFTWTIPFLCGRLYKNNCFGKINMRVYVPVLIAFVVILVMQRIYIVNWYDTNWINFGTVLSKLISIYLFFGLFKLIENTYIGMYFLKYGVFSLIIYLVHAPTGSIVRVLLFKIGIDGFFWQLFLGIFITWNLCVFVIWISKKSQMIDFLFYPNKYIWKKQKI